MKKFFLTFGSLLLILFTACNSPTKQSDSKSEPQLTPVGPEDQHRYNINAPTEELINLDTTHKDSSQIETHP